MPQTRRSETPAPVLGNVTRARRLLQSQGLDGLVVCLPHNVYYLSSYWGLLMSAAHFDAAFFALLPAREDQPASLILPSMELRRLESAGGTWMPETFIYTSPGEEQDQIAIDGQAYSGWPVRDGAELTSLERRWIAKTRAQAQRTSGNSRGALVRALRNAGLSRAKLAVDDERVGPWLSAAGLDKVECLEGRTLLSETRRIKTGAELNLMKEAAKINESAARTAAAALRDGAHWDDIEQLYFTAMAQQGGRGSYLICGAGGPPSGVVRRNEPMLIDALGTYRHYHGDFGRSMVLGEPSTLMRKRHRALCNGWDAVQSLLKPGVRMSELADTAIETIRRNGFPEFVYATPHNLGLEHTDDAMPVGAQQGAGDDAVLEAGMVLNVDLPFTEIGWGSMHLEDTVHITHDGFEALTSMDLDIIVV